MADKLFVGGLSFSTSSERLREIFAEAGRVESATVVTDRQTGQSRGFGFVEMATPEDGDAAISRFNGARVDGRQLKVERSTSSGAKRGGTGGGGGGGGYRR
jgi:RNA recognition motif-containing protein